MPKYVQHTDKDFIDMYNVCYNAIEIALNTNMPIDEVLEGVQLENNETRNIPFYTDETELSFMVVSTYVVVMKINSYQMFINNTNDSVNKNYYTHRIKILQDYIYYSSTGLDDDEFNYVTKRTGDMMDCSTKKMK
jgi:hypothetical protein